MYQCPGLTFLCGDFVWPEEASRAVWGPGAGDSRDSGAAPLPPPRPAPSGGRTFGGPEQLGGLAAPITTAPPRRRWTDCHSAFWKGHPLHSVPSLLLQSPSISLSLSVVPSPLRCVSSVKAENCSMRRSRRNGGASDGGGTDEWKKARLARREILIASGASRSPVMPTHRPNYRPTDRLIIPLGDYTDAWQRRLSRNLPTFPQLS